MKDFIHTLGQLCRNDPTFRISGLGAKGRVKQYLKKEGFAPDDIKGIIANLEKYLQEKCKTEIDKRQLALAEADQEYSKHLKAKRDYDENPYLQNTIHDLIELLKDSKYTERDTLMQQ